MNKGSHNKKRNVGIIFEQLTKYMSKAVLEKDYRKAKQILQIIRECFKPGTELYREFRLFNALIKTRVPREGLATRILEDARNASRNFNANKLRHEKSGLIKKINCTLDDSTFYNQRIKEYRDYATIQTLLNDWRKNEKADIARVVKYENEVTNWLLSETVHSLLHDEECGTENINALTVKIMNEKFNKKYGDSLNKEQQDIVKQYVFDTDLNSPVKIEKYDELKKQAIKEIQEYSKTCNNDVLNEKIENVIKKINNFQVKQIDDVTVSRLLTISSLKQELLENQCER
jgi:hypothetical protein